MILKITFFIFWRNPFVQYGNEPKSRDGIRITSQNQTRTLEKNEEGIINLAKIEMIDILGTYLPHPIPPWLVN